MTSFGWSRASRFKLPPIFFRGYSILYNIRLEGRVNQQSLANEIWAVADILRDYENVPLAKIDAELKQVEDEIESPLKAVTE